MKYLHFNSTDNQINRIKGCPLDLHVSKMLHDMELRYKKRLDTSQRVLGLAHPLTIAIMNELTWVHRHQGRYDEALNISEEILVLCKAVLGAHSNQYDETQPENVEPLIMNIENDKLQALPLQLCQSPDEQDSGIVVLGDRQTENRNRLGRHLQDRYYRGKRRVLQLWKSSQTLTLQVFKRRIRATGGYSVL
jgi:hypothetical protein